MLIGITLNFWQQKEKLLWKQTVCSNTTEALRRKDLGHGDLAKAAILLHWPALRLSVNTTVKNPTQCTHVLHVLWQ
ncbi:hypothetical protein NPIL_401751, partial [Nephila pilipes]